MSLSTIFHFIFSEYPIDLFTLNGTEAFFREVQHSTHFQTSQLFHYGTLFYMWLRTGIPEF
jgi:hypothetical protein